MHTEDVIKTAQNRTGVCDMHSDSFREGLEIVVDAVNVGPQTLERTRRISDECTRALMGRLLVDDWFARHPHIAEIPIKRPVFVIGMPRTGTTALLNLIGQDRKHSRVLWHWEIDRPTPPVQPDHLLDDPRIAAKTAELAPLIKRLSHFPRMEKATDPVECVHLLAQDFKALTWHASTGSSRYSSWLLYEADLRSAYAHHHRTLQVLQSGGAAGQWVLKMPWHALHLEALLGRYPDARVVMTHRDPLLSVVSMCSYAAMMQEAGGNRVKRAELVDAMWRQVLESTLRPIDFFATHPKVPVYHIFQQELAADPVEQVARLRAWMGLERDERLDARMRAYLTTEWAYPPGRHRYTADDFGITRARVNGAFAAYIDRFAIPVETS